MVINFQKMISTYKLQDFICRSELRAFRPRAYVIAQGFAYIFDGVIRLITLGEFEGDFSTVLMGEYLDWRDKR